MRIVKINDTNLRTDRMKNKDFILSVVDEILLICKEDKNFSKVNSDIDSIDPELNETTTKIKKQEFLLVKSNEIKDDLLKKIEILNNENYKKRNELLESLGSAI